MFYIRGGQTFLIAAKFENYFSSWAALLEITDFKVTILAKQKMVLLMLLLTIFDQIFHNRKRSKGLKNKLEGHSLAMSVLYRWIPAEIFYSRLHTLQNLIVDAKNKTS